MTPTAAALALPTVPLISRQSIEELKLRINIYDVISPVVSLKRSGRNFVGLSPFNQEKTPSFYVLPDKGIYKCFSSGNAGDIFKFVEETEKLTFVEAVEALAERFSIPLQYEGGSGPRPEERSLRRQLLELHEYATDFFHRTFLGELPEAATARDYWLEKRGFPLELAKDFKIGFAPVKGFELNRFLLDKGFPVEALRQCGLFYARDYEPDPSRFRARFRGRLMVPIRDHQGQVVAFTARQLSVTPDDDPTREAKYVNSPETPLFHKSNLVFNLERARTGVEEEGAFHLVEGQLDAIRCWHSGIRSAVAPQGTSVTVEQMRLLRRYTDRLNVVLDGDRAGQKAALRVLPLALSSGLEVTFTHLPEGEDPDSYLVAHGPAAFRDLLEEATHAMRFAADALLPENPSPRDRSNALQGLFQILAECDSEVARQAYLEDAAPLFEVSLGAAQRDFRAFLARTRRTQPTSPTDASGSPEAPAPKGKLTTAESDLLLIVLHHGELATPIAQVLEASWIDYSIAEGRILGRLIAEISEGLADIVEDPEFLRDTPDDRNTLFSYLADERRFDEPRAVANAGLATLYLRFLRQRLASLDEEIANSGEDNDRLLRLLSDRKTLKKAQLSRQLPHLAEV